MWATISKPGSTCPGSPALPLAVLPGRAALWTDGRYFLQAERQLEGSGIELMRTGQPDVPTLSAFLAQHLPEGGVLGFDGRTVSTRLYRTLEEALSAKHIRLDGAHDLAEEVWPDRPALSAQPLWPLESDVSRREKLSLLREKMAEKNAGHLLLTDLTDIAWTLNLRGGRRGLHAGIFGVPAAERGGRGALRPAPGRLPLHRRCAGR